ncbi:MAG TPA: HlyD family secretion protein [Crenalkalicoccus sp.]|jgi:membrane fusion protein (multidrug efflux system)|nr:HlyD family secretion protein [Crenalkalicoccus sp.]
MSHHPSVFPMETEIPVSRPNTGPAVPHALLAKPPGQTPKPAEHGLRPAGRRTLRGLLLAGGGLLALAAMGDLGWRYWTVGRFEVSTTDAYVKADSTTVAPKVAGHLAAVLVGDNERVEVGQVLARIDDRDFRAALAQARADAEAAEASIATRRAALAAQQSAIEEARATIAADQANETFAQQEARRYAALAASGYGSVQNAQQSASRIAAAHAAVARDEAALTNATRLLDVRRAELAQAEAALARAAAAVQQAELNLSYATIAAPIAGVVGNRTLRVGQYVQAGTQLMAVVPVEAVYVVANYKETQLTEVRAGQPVEVRVDTYPGRVFRGHVDSLAPASGQEFALLPPDNATGNFTKVVQRIPVRIVLDTADRPALVLRPGMSVVPTVDTRAAPQHLAAAPERRG